MPALRSSCRVNDALRARQQQTHHAWPRLVCAEDMCPCIGHARWLPRRGHTEGAILFCAVNRTVAVMTSRVAHRACLPLLLLGLQAGSVRGAGALLPHTLNRASNKRGRVRSRQPVQLADSKQQSSSPKNQHHVEGQYHSWAWSDNQILSLSRSYTGTSRAPTSDR